MKCLIKAERPRSIEIGRGLFTVWFWHGAPLCQIKRDGYGGEGDSNQDMPGAARGIEAGPTRAVKRPPQLYKAAAANKLQLIDGDTGLARDDRPLGDRHTADAVGVGDENGGI